MSTSLTYGSPPWRPWVSGFLASALGLGAAAASGCRSGGGKGKADDVNARPLVVVHEPCDETSSRAKPHDANNDGKPDLVVLSDGAREVCSSSDLDFDGRPDRYVYFDSAGNPRRIESDHDRDGRVDEVVTLRGGQVVRKDRAMSLGGKLDTWDLYERGLLVRRERDSDGDGKVDQWWSFPNREKPECAIVATDKDGDGRPDLGSQVDLCSEEGEPPSILATSSASAPPVASSAPRLAISAPPPSMAPASPITPAPGASAPGKAAPGKAAGPSAAPAASASGAKKGGAR